MRLTQREEKNMFQYNPKSMKAQEFIHDGEIRETLAYAEANKNNLPLIYEILEKARPRKTEKGWSCAGISSTPMSLSTAYALVRVMVTPFL